MTKKPIATVPDQAEVQSVILANENARLKAALKAREKDIEAAQARLEFVQSVKGQQQDRIYEKIGATGGATAILVFSDWHAGERVDPASVNGRNEYSPEICQQRAKSAAQHAGLMLDWVRKLVTVEHVVVGLLGDFIGGYIHDELRETNYLAPTEETLLVQDEIYSILKHLKRECRAKAITCVTSYGNHGRTTHKKQFKGAHANSYEWLMYRTMESHFRIPGVSWKVENGYHNWLEINGVPIRFHHGDNVQYHGGSGGPTIPINKAIAAWDRERTAGLDVFGHFHQFMPMRKFCCNGSLIGWSETSVAFKCDYEGPSQSMVVIADDGKVILKERVFCE